ncbi:MAG: glycoside hydrolase family 75 protein [Brasilonema angustatum HA4187-MV1]|nr:glycoside hydrolase family 75 protein [Brasilonema angustatum HA4187-MV1]
MSLEIIELTITDYDKEFYMERRSFLKQMTLFSLSGFSINFSDKVSRKFLKAESKDVVNKAKIFEHGKYTVWKLVDRPGFFFKSGMAIDADGAPNAYHPQDVGIDNLKHAGKPGNWWALVTDKGIPNGNPIIQGTDDPYPGYYISTTALCDETKEITNPKRYVDSREIPYIVLPENNNEEFLKKTNIKLGDFAVIYNGNNGKFAFAIFADTSLYFAGDIEEYRFGEGSIALAKALGISLNPKNGGVKNNIIYTIFPGSGNGKPRSIREINTQGAKYFQQWGGVAQIQTCLISIPDKDS